MSPPARTIPNEVAKIYDYPSGDGSGQCIGIIELGGGFQLDDLSKYFGALNINVPQVISVSGSDPASFVSSSTSCITAPACVLPLAIPV